jgi:hypothetical protein
MKSKLNWNFRVNWVGNDHILIAYKEQDNDEWDEFLLTVREYTEWMSLLQDFNSAFHDRIEQQLLNSYLNG